MSSLLMLPETRLRDSRISASEAPLTITRRPVELAGGLTRGCSVSSSEGRVSAGDWERVVWTLTGETIGLGVLWIGGGQYIASMSEGAR